MFEDIYPFYFFIKHGEFPADKLFTKVIKNTLKRDVKSEKFIDRMWEIYPGEKWPNDEHPSRFNLTKSSVIKNSLVLAVDPCISYKDYIGTRSLDFQKQFGKEYTPKPLSADALVVTSDSKILITRRNTDSDNKPGGLHASLGGWITIADDYMDQKLNLSRAILREIEEESGIRSNEVLSLLSYGIINSYLQNELAIIFEIHVNITSVEILKRKNDGENKLYAINDNSKDIEKWLSSYLFAFCSPAIALLLVHGAINFGDVWLKKMLSIIKKRNGDIDNFLKSEAEDLASLNLFFNNL